MKTVGIITEYNPFHNGHLYHLEQTAKLTGCHNIITVMSGDFVQRGEPAIINKYVRTKMALLSGVDVVAELPPIFSCASAEYFAYGALLLLDSLNIVDSISFGAECDDIGRYNEIVNLLTNEPDDYKKFLRSELSTGCSFPTARMKAVERITGGGADLLTHPNNILAIEYQKAIKRLNSQIKPFPVKRIAADHNSKTIDGPVCSASAIRKAITSGNFDTVRQTMPPPVFDLLINEINSGKTTNLNNLSDIFHYIIKTQRPEELSKIMDVIEGLENRLIKCSEKHFYLTDIIKSAKTKRYTYTCLQRAILHIILGIKAADFDYSEEFKAKCYIRILGFKKEKSKLVKQIQEQSSLPVLIRMKKDSEKLSTAFYNMPESQLRASNIYNMSLGNGKAPFRKDLDLYADPIII